MYRQVHFMTPGPRIKATPATGRVRRANPFRLTEQYIAAHFDVRIEADHSDDHCSAIQTATTLTAMQAAS